MLDLDQNERGTKKLFGRETFGGHHRRTDGVVLFSWAFLIIPLLIKMENRKGPVFFRQTRIGKDGKPFTMYKFRSMVVNAEETLTELLPWNEASGALFKIKDDPPITKIGRILRKESLDELPQIWNVLKGDMSLVGPRPPLPNEYKKYRTYGQTTLARPARVHRAIASKRKRHYEFRKNGGIGFARHPAPIHSTRYQNHAENVLYILFESKGSY